MLFFKIFQMFFTPSVFIFGFLSLGVIFIFLLDWRKLGKVLLVFGILIYYLFSITPIADLILLPLENQYNPLKEINSVDPSLLAKGEGVDTIVLLIGGSKMGDLTLDSNLSESSLSRTVETIRLYFKATKKPKIIISGRDPISPENKEAYFITKFMENFNIPKGDIILEEESRNTYESARNIKRIVGEKPFLLVTSAFHMPRVIYIFKTFETNPVPAPCDYRGRPFGGYGVLDFFPQPGNLEKVNIAFHEYLGFSFYYVVNYLTTTL